MTYPGRQQPYIPPSSNIPLCQCVFQEHCTCPLKYLKFTSYTASEGFKKQLVFISLLSPFLAAVYWPPSFLSKITFFFFSSCQNTYSYSQIFFSQCWHFAVSHLWLEVINLLVFHLCFVLWGEALGQSGPSGGCGEVVPSLEGRAGAKAWELEGKARQQAGIVAASSRELTLQTDCQEGSEQTAARRSWWGKDTLTGEQSGLCRFWVDGN